MRLVTGVALASALAGNVAWAQPVPLIVVYGPDAPTREGDVDHLERLYLSVPADFADRLYLRVFDPEPAGTHDTRYGRSPATTTTLFRLSGGEGAYSAAPPPAAVGDGDAPAALDPAYAAFAGGRVIALETD